MTSEFDLKTSCSSFLLRIPGLKQNYEIFACHLPFSSSIVNISVKELSHWIIGTDFPGSATFSGGAKFIDIKLSIFAILMSKENKVK